MTVRTGRKAARGLPAGERHRGLDAVRHPGDVVRVILGVLLLLAVTAAVKGRPLGSIETNLFHLVNDLPHAVRTPVFVVMQLGALTAVPVVAAVALLLRRPLLGRDCLVAGSAAWLLTKVVKEYASRPRPAALLTGVDLHLPESGLRGFPSGHAAVAAALVAAASPYLSPRLRRLAWTAVVAVGLARIFAGLHLPYDVLGGAALGWAVGAAVHLLWGAPGGRPATAAVRRAAEEAGLRLRAVRPLRLDARGSTPFLLVTDEGRELFAKAVGKVQRDADLLYKAWRYLVFRRPMDEFPLATPKQLVQHEAHLSMLAERGGARTPPLVLDTMMADGTMLLIEQHIVARALDSIDATAVTDELLVDLWRQVSRLRAIRVAHRDLRLANVLVDDEGRPWLIDFGAAEAGASEHRLAQDVAQLLASLALVVGPERACRAACEGVGPPAVAAALPLLQPLALAADTRQRLRTAPGLLDDIRRQAALTSGGTAPELERLPRPHLRALLLVVGVGVATYAPLPRLGDLRLTAELVRGAQWGWVLAALAASGVSYVAAAVAQIGAAGQALSLTRTTAVQLATSFVRRMTPAGVDGTAVGLHYLQRCGVPRTRASSTLALTDAASFVLHALALLVTVPLAARSLRPLDRLPSLPLLLTGAGALVVLGLVLWPSIGRRRIPALRDARRALTLLLDRPRWAAALLAGTLGVTGANLLALAAALQVFHVDLRFVDLVAVYLVGSAVGALAATPGGLGATEAALIAGLVVTGADPGPALAGVLAFRLATYWLPMVSGWVVFRQLRRHEELS